MTRDEVRQATHVEGRGADSTQYPWGKRTHHEQLTYDVEDKHPEINVVRGDSDTTFQLQDRSLLYRGHLEMRSDQKTFYYSYQRELLENGRLIARRRGRMPYLRITSDPHFGSSLASFFDAFEAPYTI